MWQVLFGLVDNNFATQVDDLIIDKKISTFTCCYQGRQKKFNIYEFTKWLSFITSHYKFWLLTIYILRLIEFNEIYCFFRRYIFVGCILALNMHLFIKSKENNIFLTDLWFCPTILECPKVWVFQYHFVQKWPNFYNNVPKSYRRNFLKKN